jgi:nucleoside phosphorylase/HEAT repeat protein
VSTETVNETTALTEHHVKPTVGIITALPHEYAAVKVLLESQRPIVVSGRGAGRQYLYGELSAPNGRHRIVLALLPDVGNNHASARAALLTNHFPSINLIIMAGIAGGIPHPERPAEHVRLGDIVVSNRDGVVQYDFGKEELGEADIEFTPRHPPRPPSATMVETARLLQAGEFEGKRPWDRYIDRSLKSLSAARPAAETDLLFSSADPTKEITHPNDPKRLKELPRVFLGPIASSNSLLKNPLRRDRLRDRFGVKAVEMEGSGIADAAWELEIQYVIVRGICDYCDGKKGDDWQPYAAVAAAGYTRALLEATPASNSKLVEGAHSDRDIDLQQIVKAAQTTARSLANELIDGRPTISRERLIQRFDAFLASPARYAFVLGPTGTGKSILMALEARRLGENEWVALLLRGSLFSLEHATNVLAQELSSGKTLLAWSAIVRPWTRGTPNSPGLVILLDAIDEADPDEIAHELLRLHDSLRDAPLERVKIIISCRDFAWNKLRQHRLLPQYENLDELRRRSSRSSITIHVADFTHDELNDALRKIGANELLTAGTYGERIDRHVATMRDLLQHPGTFDHYANLHASGEIAPLQSLTWSELLAKRIRAPLRRAAHDCPLDEDQLLELLVKFAALCWQQHARDFQLEARVVKEALPEFDDRRSARRTPHEVLLGSGILHESTEVSRKMIGLRAPGAGSYLLSHELTRIAGDKTTEDLRELVARWANEARFSLTTLDALLAWINRLVENPRNTVLQQVVEVLVEDFYFTSRSFFRLLSPSVIGVIFEIVKREGFDQIFFYREAIQGVRTAPESLAIIRRHLHDPNPVARQLAAASVGMHQDSESQTDLMSLLEDSEESVRGAAATAFGRLGRQAISTLAKVIQDSSRSAEIRGRHLFALREIGFLDEQGSKAIELCLEDDANSSASLVTNALLTAAHLRDRNQARYAIRGLGHPDDQVVNAAAYYLKQVPTPAAFEPLCEALRPITDESGTRVDRYWIPRQLLAALMETDKEKAEPIALQLIREGLSGEGELYPAEAILTAEALEIAPAQRIILENLASELVELTRSGNIWLSSQVLGRAWIPEHIDLMSQTTAELLNNGTDLAQTLVDNLLPSVARFDEYPVEQNRDGVSDVLAAAKCQASIFVPAAARLVRDARTVGAAEVCELLWVAADPRAEAALLDRMQHPVAQGKDSWYERGQAARALGTCGSRHGGKAVLDYLRSSDSGSVDFAEEALSPLVRSGALDATELVSIARNDSPSINSRLICLESLGRLNAVEHHALFQEIALGTGEASLQRYASKLLGLSKDKSVISILIKLLREGKDFSVKAQAAETLGRLDAREAIADIERALEENHARQYIDALAHFRHRPLVDLLTHSVSRSHREFRSIYLHALGSYWEVPEARRAIMEQFEDWARDESRRYDNQSPLIEGLVKYEPNTVLQQVNKAYDIGYLGIGARQTVAHLIPKLFSANDVKVPTLKQTIKRLLCDRDLLTRELTANSLKQTSTAFCQELFDELYGGSSDEWTRSCAVSMLGFLEFGDTQIESVRYVSELLVRQAADKARIMQLKHRRLDVHISQFGSVDGMARLSSYLCLKEHGDISTIHELRHFKPQDTLANVFLTSVTKSISERLREEYRKRKEEEKKRWDARGTIWFQ